MSIYHLDYESTSVCDISLGSYRYGCDPSTRILMFAIAKDDGEPLLWNFKEPESAESREALALLSDAINDGSLVYAHNATFELAVSTYRMSPDLGITPPALEAWRCTRAMCQRAAAPESLAAAAEFFGLGNKKSEIGKALISIFSIQGKSIALHPPKGMVDPSTVKVLKNGNMSKGTKPKPRYSDSPILESEVPWDWQMKIAGDFMTVREAWDTFCAYCKQDVRVEQQLHTKLKRFELTGDELASFQFDLRMNFRGVPVNMDALHKANELVEEYKKKLEARLHGMCDGIASGQRAKLLAWLKERGYPEDDLTAGTVEKILDNPPDTMRQIAVAALRVRSMLSFAALKKIPVMRDAAGPDQRVRGTTQWHAARTGRSAGRIIQPQNFRKSTIGEDSHLCYRLICDGCDLTYFEDLWESPLEAIASSIRHFIQPKEGVFLDIDFKGVEARITSWIVGDVDGLQSILDGVDQYKAMASKLFNVPYDEVTKEQRTIAKPVVLGCCFGVGGKGLMEALAKPPYNVIRTRKECDDYVRIYRETNTDTVRSWREIDDAAKNAIKQPGTIFHACDKRLSFVCGKAAGIPYLVLTLPSSRRLYYPHPQVKSVFRKYEEEDMIDSAWKREKGGYWIDQISFYGKLRETANWGRVGTFGSRLFENVVQATGACLLNRGCIEAERRGYEIVMVVHDQALAQGGTLEGFLEAMTTKDQWAETFPLEADGSETPYYTKD